MPRIDPQAVKDIADRWESEVLPHLEAAIAAVARTESTHFGNVTAVSPVLAAVHVQAENFMQNELQTKVMSAHEFATSMRHDADCWDEAEQTNLNWMV